MGKNIILGAYILISILLFATFSAGLPVWIAFLVNNLLLFGFLYNHLKLEKEFSPFISIYIVFTFLFFIVAPIIQIGIIGGRNDVFATQLPYFPGKTIFTNVLVAIFNITFFLSYKLFKQSRKPKVIKEISESRTKQLPLIIIILLGLSLLIFVGTYGFIVDEMGRSNWMESSISISKLLIIKKVLLMLPFAGLIYCFQYYKTMNKNSKNVLSFVFCVLLLSLLLIWFKNPLTEKRNALGPIYICIIFMITPKLLSTNVRMTAFMFFSMVVIFPLSAIFTHFNSSISDIIRKPRILIDEFEGEGISEVFNTLHYDAFINITATQDYVNTHGYAWGEQLLSAFMFFVPRSLWEDKPLTTGKLVGEHLMDNYDLNFSNLSNPMVSEGYINFGILGVILIAILLALTVVGFLNWIKSKSLVKKVMAMYFAIHLLFFLRGDFANGFSYFVGILIGVYGISRFIEVFVNRLYYNINQWKKQEAVKA